MQRNREDSELLNASQLKTVVLNAVHNGSTLIDPQCKAQMQQQGIDDSDLVRSLEYGNYNSPPVWVPNLHSWMYSVVGKNLDGDLLKIFLTVDEFRLTIRDVAK